MKAFFLVAVFGVFLFSAIEAVNSDSIGDKVDIQADEAKDFNKPLSRARRGIYHECYNEGCSFEEVEEVMGRTEQAYEYYYTYTCNKFKKNCKVKCIYRKDCSFGNWGHWSGSGNGSPGCFSQKRYKPYRYSLQTLYQRWNCNGLHTTCPSPSAESRLYCICQKALCREGTWSTWQGTPSQGECASQTRQKPFHITWTTQHQIGSCDGISKKCNSPSVDLQRMCSCPRAVCSLNSWSVWQGSVSQGSCATQSRTRSYSKTISYEMHADCSGVKSSCPAQQSESRKMCSCKYATCKLGEWSEWEPKQLDQGSCGQSQSRKKSYTITWAYQSHQGNCPSLPQKCPDPVAEQRQQCMCAYRDSCDMNDWTEWSDPVTAEGCKLQTRRRTYVNPVKYVQRAGCEGLNSQCLVEPTETRTFCKCKSAQCSLGEWSEWGGETITSGSCEEQTRTKAYKATMVLVDKLKSCDGVDTTCPADKTESRRMCNCNTAKCEVGKWGAWEGDITADTCSTQTRSKSTKETRENQYQENTCDGLPVSCAADPQESRRMCNCSFREDCTLKEWQAWTGDIPDVGCARQIRTREYNNSIIHLVRGSCEGLPSCTVIKDEARIKCNCNKINCDWSKWFRESFDAETNCYTETRVKNASSGFQKIERMENCDGIPTLCDENNVERRKDCQSGGGGHQIFTTPTPLPTVTTVAPTTAFVPATYVQIGCFKDGKEGDGRVRTFPHLIENLRNEITNWNDLSNVIQKCANIVRELRLEYFGIQFYGECWSDREATCKWGYARDGLHVKDNSSSDCYKGVGGLRTNMVYRIEDMPACSSELTFETSVSSGAVNSGNDVWCAGNTDRFQWITIELDKPMKISGVGTQGGTQDSWVTLYNVEYSEEGEAWVPYQESREPKTFAGNSDQFTLQTYWLKNVINARFLRFKPLSWKSVNICMKIRVYGCSV